MWLVAMFAAGCDELALDTGDSQARESAAPEEDPCAPAYEGDFSSSAREWTSDGLCLTVRDGHAGNAYLFGMAETGSGEGWYGEDCVDGPGPNSGDYDFCHPVTSCETVCLETVRTPEDVVAGSTTLLTDTIGNAGNITYVLGDETDCWTWGNDVSYYTSSLGCASI